MADTTELTPSQERFLHALLILPSITAAAEQAGIAERTARRWYALDHFQETFQAAKKQVFEHALDRLQTGMGKAIDALERNISEEAPPPVQVHAAQIILKQGIELHKMSDLERKIAALEQVLKDKTE